MARCWPRAAQHSSQVTLGPPPLAGFEEASLQLLSEVERRAAASLVAMSLGEPKIKVGDTFPADVVVHVGFAGNTPEAPQTMGSLLSGKKCLVVTLPGAFTPT
jgi:hypothetical protein